jgi:hypothetical protein
MLTKAKVRQAAWISTPLARSNSSAKPRFRIGAIALVCAITCGVALMIAALGMVACDAAAEPQSRTTLQPTPGIPVQDSGVAPRTYEGVITDTQCGAKHSAVIGKTASDCTLACVHGGRQFALVDGDATYLLEGDMAMLKRAAGQRVKIIGTLNGRKISVTSVVTP